MSKARALHPCVGIIGRLREEASNRYIYIYLFIYLYIYIVYMDMVAQPRPSSIIYIYIYVSNYLNWCYI